MMPVLEYVHAINGRMRVKVPEVKRSTTFARRIEGWLASIEGIREVRANPVTGNVLILHDPERIATREILGALIAAGYMGMGIADADEPAAEETAAAALAVQAAELLCLQIIRVLAGFTPGPGWFQELVETTARFVLRLLFGRVSAAMA
jgi:copper chaperone CopZ